MQGLFERGIKEFNNQQFFEAHDTWEGLWLETRGECRLFYQGLIQAAVGFYHLGNSNLKGASSQLGKSLAKLERYPPGFHGIRIAPLIDALQESLRSIEAARNGKMSKEFRLPFIEHVISTPES